MLIISNTDDRPIYINRKEGARGLAARERDTERVCVCERQRVAENGGSVSCKNSRWRNGPVGISQDQNRRIALIVRNYFNGQGQITQIIDMKKDAWRHLVLGHLVPFPQQDQRKHPFSQATDSLLPKGSLSNSFSDS